MTLQEVRGELARIVTSLKKLVDSSWEEGPIMTDWTREVKRDVRKIKSLVDFIVKELEEEGGIVVTSPGDDAPETGYCENCNKQFVGRGEGVKTVNAYGPIVLCWECYKKAGNRVR